MAQAVVYSKTMVPDPNALEPLTRPWDELLGEAALAEEYPADLKRGIVDAVAFLRKELGEINERPWRGPDFRLWRVETNRAPWTRHWLVWLAASLRRLSNRPGYKLLRRRLRSPRGFAEATDIIEVAEVCASAGLDLEFDPPVIIRGKPRRPDLLVSVCKPREQLFVEVTTLHDPLGLRDAERIMNQLIHALMTEVPVQFAGRCERLPLADELALVLDSIHRTAEKAKVASTVQVLCLPGLIEVGFVRDGGQGALATWAGDRRIKPMQFVGPEVNTRETWRVINALREKARQLPESRPGVVVINNQRVRPSAVFGSDELGDRSDVIAALKSLPHVLCVILCASAWSVTPPSLEGIRRPAWSWIATRRIHNLRQLDYEFIWNPAFTLSRPGSIIARVYAEFLRGHRSWSSQPTAHRMEIS